MTSLPPELWRRIACLIPIEDFRLFRLYALNKTLLWFYLEERYSRLCLRYLISAPSANSRNIKVESNLHFLKGPSMISQVTKDLELFLHEGLYQDPASRLTSWMRSILTWSESASPTFPSLSTPSGGLSQLNRLSSMKCTLSCYRRVSRVIPISSVLITALSSVWRASWTSLTSLTIVIRTRQVPNLGLAEIVFPNLRELSLSLSCDPSITPGDAKRFNEANRSLEKFFMAHKSILLINVPHLPHLDNLTLHFDFYCDAKVAAIIVELLKIHSCQLTSLGLYLTMFHVEANSRWIDSSMEHCDGCLSELPGWNTADLMAIEFPNLAHLSLNITEFTIARAFMSKHMQKLRELNIQRYMNNTKPVLLLDDIRAAGSGGQLEKLDLRVDTFNAQLMQNLSRSLPNLRILSVEFYTLDPSVWPCRDDDPVVLPNAIAQLGITLPDSTWALEQLSLRRSTMLDQTPREFRVALLAALPSLKVINKWRREDFIDAGCCWQECH
ncbi:hypothetical protein NP233_g8020 [Leucocoprinus birnbaumii]|uniref:Uncharacterized protein n=1 Tax=Leucocoprinus birnbaumii TaxID=56174 RepID=A0AAD5YU39_9AGAR|nr:hypothetical protein NP233_g8020 [Leucocoprinus birnbaumii]